MISSILERRKLMMTVAGSSSAVGDPSTPPPSKKRKLIFDLNELAKMWSISVDEVREIIIENNTVIQKKKEARKGERLSAKLAQALASTVPLNKMLMFKAIMIMSKKI